MGDSAEVLFVSPSLLGDTPPFEEAHSKQVPRSILSIYCQDGGADYLYGGSGDVDYIIGGGFNDYVEGNEGMDLVFGDHAFILLNSTMPFKLEYAQTIYPNCTPGNDNITLGPGGEHQILPLFWASLTPATLSSYDLYPIFLIHPFCLFPRRRHCLWWCTR